MGQEFIIKSQSLEDKINQLLPSQGGFQAGVDLSASTTIIPVVNLTEAAEGSSLRQDLQTSLSHGSITSFVVANATTTIISNTGYWRVFGAISAINISNAVIINISISDGATDKIILDGHVSSLNTSVGASPILPFDFNVYLKAGDSLKAISNNVNVGLAGCVRQIADINGNLINPL